MRPLLLRNSYVRERNRSARMVQNMREQLNSRCEGLDSNYDDPENSETMPLFSNISAAYEGNTFVPNDNLWCNDIRSQLTGIHMGAGNFHQTYGLMPLGDRFALSCGHNGPELNEPGSVCTVKYVSATGVVETATAVAKVNAYGAADSEVVAAGVPAVDMQIYAFSNDIPSFAYRAPLLALTASDITAIHRRGGETVMISQGNRTDGIYPEQNTPKNRKVYRSTPSNGLFPIDWRHYITVGDSGTPSYVLLNDVLYLVGVISGFSMSQTTINYLNILIGIAAARSGNTPITVALTPNPIA